VVRRTKEDALETRARLLDAAECLFQANGVSRTSLEAIARRAGASRGAIYWHFKDKAALFNAMMERVTLPLETAFGIGGDIPPSADVEPEPLLRIRRATCNALRQIVTDGQMRRVLEVATQKVEYVEELQAVRLRHIASMRGFASSIAKAIEGAAEADRVSLPLPAAMAGLGFHALIDGLVQNWLLDTSAFDLLKVGGCTMDVYLKGLGFAVGTEAAP
jgi:TetR/AcrR family transcriptional regulator, acrAB operon repressor